MSSGRSAQRQRVRIEYEVVPLLCELVLPCARVPFSGAIGGAYSGDIDLELCGRIARIQAKFRREFRTLHQWLAANELLILKADHQDPLVVIPVHLFAELATATQKVRP